LKIQTKMLGARRKLQLGKKPTLFGGRCLGERDENWMGLEPTPCKMHKRGEKREKT